MGAPKQKWTAEEEAALKAGITKHGAGKWRTILKDPEFSNVLRYRSNVDLKDKWRNMNVTVHASGTRDKGRTPTASEKGRTPTASDKGKASTASDKGRTLTLTDKGRTLTVTDKGRTPTVTDKGKASTAKKPRSTPKHESHSTALTVVTSDGDDDIADVMPLATSSSTNRSLSRLDNIIMEAVRTMNEPTGSHKAAIANYIEEQYWPPADFDNVLSSKLNELTASEKLIKVNRKYRIAPSSSFSEGRGSKMMLLEDVRREPVKIERDDFATLTKSQIDVELARMRNMTPEEATAAATRSVAEAEAFMAEAEAAVREAEAAEAEAVAAQAFADAAHLSLKNKNSVKLIIRG